MERRGNPSSLQLPTTPRAPCKTWLHPLRASDPTTGLTIMGLHFQQLLEWGRIFSGFGGNNIQASREFVY